MIEDDAEAAQTICRALSGEGHEVSAERVGWEGLASLLREAPDLMIVDRMLPDMDGLEIVETVRVNGYLGPVLLLTALGSIEDRVTGLRAGADDYLVKPFAIAELIARVEALLRRGANQQEVASFGSIRIDRMRREAWREDRRVVLQPREFELLERLVSQNGKTVSRTMLLEQVWHLHFDPQTNIVETHMSRLRQKLNAGFDVDAIRTVRGIGYSLRNDG
ncbi:response regulator transcription factor [Sphingomonas sp. PAMC26645]|uniref:response regulator transcription factor n=1 Tax=Sphingomonas sp. PAMC26645 TaxID=2565555 RepID=UPI001FF80EF2|nr:response regulator transcription factor [Sphingomonas sp. PAMC26645]